MGRTCKRCKRKVPHEGFYYIENKGNYCPECTYEIIRENTNLNNIEGARSTLEHIKIVNQKIIDDFEREGSDAK